MNAMILPILASIVCLFIFMIRQIWWHYSASISSQTSTSENSSVLTPDDLFPKEMFCAAPTPEVQSVKHELPSSSPRNERQHSELVDEYIGDFFSEKMA
jgi:hypothetical protein